MDGLIKIQSLSFWTLVACLIPFVVIGITYFLFCIFYLLYVAFAYLIFFIISIELNFLSLYSYWLKSYQIYFYSFSGYPSI